MTNETNQLIKHLCANANCLFPPLSGSTKCGRCTAIEIASTKTPSGERSAGRRHTDGERTMSQKYPKYYKPIPPDMKELDFYAVAQIFGVSDAMISHSMKKLMLPGVRTGGKSRWDDIKEARDTLNRWLELNDPT